MSDVWDDIVSRAESLWELSLMYSDVVTSINIVLVIEVCKWLRSAASIDNHTAYTDYTTDTHHTLVIILRTGCVRNNLIQYVMPNYFQYTAYTCMYMLYVCLPYYCISLVWFNIHFSMHLIVTWSAIIESKSYIGRLGHHSWQCKRKGNHIH